MAIAEMSEITLLGRTRESMDVMRALQNSGVMHIDPVTLEEGFSKLTPEQAEARGLRERLLARAQASLAVLNDSVGAPVVANHSKLSGLELDSYIEKIASDVDVLSRERDGLRDELDSVNSFGGVAKSLSELSAGLGSSGRVASLGFTLKDEKDLAKLQAVLSENLAGRFELGYKPSENTHAAVLAISKEDAAAARAALSRAGLSELRFSGRFDGLSYEAAAKLMAERSRIAPEALAGVHDSLNRIARDNGPALAAATDELRDEIGRYEALGAGAQGKYGFALRGFVPNANRAQLEQTLSKLSVVHHIEGVDPHHAHDVPVKLENAPIWKPFELLLGIFQPPPYGGFDPTWVLGLFFPLFFGFIIGDIGLGLVSLAIAFMLQGMAKQGKSLVIGFMGITVPPAALVNVVTILKWMSLWSIVWGFVFGEFFGTLGEHLGIFFNPHHEGAEAAIHEAKGMFPILIHRVAPSNALLMMNIALVPGIFQILYGWFMRFRLGLAHNDKKHIWEGIGMFVGLVGLILVGWSFRNPGTPAVVNYIAYVCFAVFLVSVFLAGVPLMLMEILSNGGNILSYLRLYAVGLSSAVLANLGTDLGWSIGQSTGGVPGIILGFVVTTFIYLFSITLTIIGHVLQPLRLHYAEFFTKFGFYDESGRPYKPFTRLGSKPVSQ